MKNSQWRKLGNKKRKRSPSETFCIPKKAITQIALRNPLFSDTDIKNCFEKSHRHSVSSRTYHRTLLRSGISKKMPKKVPNISQQQKIKRLDFCKQFNFPGFFDNVFLTNESTFQLHRNTIKVWSSKNSSYPKKKAPKFSQKIMVLGALSKKRFSIHIYQNNANVNSELYQDTLAYFISYANKLYPDGWILEQDGATHIQQPALEITCQGMAFNFCSRHRIHPIFGLLRMCGRYSSMRLRKKIRKILTNLDNMLGIVAQFWI